MERYQPAKRYGITKLINLKKRRFSNTWVLEKRKKKDRLNYIF